MNTNNPFDTMLLILETRKTFLPHVCYQNTFLICTSTILVSNKLYMICRYK